MNKKKFVFLSMIALLVVSCSDDVPSASLSSPEETSPLVVYASINGVGSVMSRAAQMTTDDKWSYVDFTSGDVMGFYASGGNMAEGQGSAPFDNLPLKYDADANQFHDRENGVVFSPSNMNGSQIFMYFPYEENMNTSGLVLRSTSGDVDVNRCIDFLSSNSITLQGVEQGKDVALYGKFIHAFSELIIMRGKGFDKPPTNRNDDIDYGRITAVLDNGYTHVKVNLNTTGTWSCTPELVFTPRDESSDDADKQKEKEDARKWDAWKGGNYGITGDNPEGQEAWYVIVPTLQGARSRVEYIELYDNDGNLLRVSSLKLSGGNSKYLDPGWRYPMEITMEELVPTVNPYPIIPWVDGPDLTDERKRGINNEAEFAAWVRDYNAYLIEPNNSDKINALLKYGDKLVDASQQISWHFYVLSDLDMSKYMPSEDDAGTGNDVIILRLQDVLDGISTTLVNSKFINHKITGLTTTFIGEMSENGSIQNFDFIKPDVRKSSDTDTAPAGIIVNLMEDASVINCNIEDGNLFHPNGPAGMVAGSIKDGKISNCTLSGLLVATKTANGDAKQIVGTTDGSNVFENNTVTVGDNIPD